MLHATAFYWDGSDTGANAQGGTGIWDTSTTNWDTAATAGTDTAFTSGATSQVVFGGTAGTVTLGTDVTVGGIGATPNGAINFDTTGYVVTATSPQTITLGANSLINGNATFNSNVLFNSSTFSLTFSNGGGGTITGGPCATRFGRLVAMK